MRAYRGELTAVVHSQSSIMGTHMLNSRRSPLPANIYFPAIPVLSKDFGKSTELLNQTVTVYLAFQGICKLVCPNGGNRVITHNLS